MTSFLCGILNKAKTKLTAKEIRFVISGMGDGEEELVKSGQKVHTSSYKINNITDVIYNMWQ